MVAGRYLYYSDLNDALDDLYNCIHLPEKGINEVILKQRKLLVVSQKIIKKEWKIIKKEWKIIKKEWKIIKKEWKIIKKGEETFKIMKKLSFWFILIVIVITIFIINENNRFDKVGDILVKIEYFEKKGEKLLVNISYNNKGNKSVSLSLKDQSEISLTDGKGNKFNYVGIDGRAVGDYYLSDLEINQKKEINFIFDYPNEYISSNENIYITSCYTLFSIEDKNKKWFKEEFKNYCATQIYGGHVP